MHITRRTAFALFVSLPLSAAAQEPVPDVGRRFEGTRGAFVLQELPGGRTIRHDAARCAERFPPCSTFKVPNALIALETGVVADAETVIRWEPRLFQPKEPLGPPMDQWARDHTLRSAMKNSVLWYFQEIARRVGEAAYAKHLAAFEYGNRDISGGLDRFWLSSSLRISADEQVAFLRKLYTGELPASPRAIRTVRDIIVLETTPEYRLSGKTGTGPLSSGGFIGWLVGYVEKGDRVFLYAMNVEGPSYEAISRERRLEITKGVLKDLGALP